MLSLEVAAPLSFRQSWFFRKAQHGSSGSASLPVIAMRTPGQPSLGPCISHGGLDAISEVQQGSWFQGTMRFAKDREFGGGKPMKPTSSTNQSIQSHEAGLQQAVHVFLGSCHNQFRMFLYQCAYLMTTGHHNRIP